MYKKELLRIKSKRKKLNAYVVVEEAKKADNPLHDFFEWDDSEAGKKWRLHQARKLITQIVQIVEIEGRESLQRTFWAPQKENPSKQIECDYVTLDEALRKKDYRQKILAQIIEHLENTTEMMRMFKRL